MDSLNRRGDDLQFAHIWAQYRYAIGVVRGTLLSVLLLAAISGAPAAAFAQGGETQLATVKYGGGGDWYQGQTPLPNLIRFIRDNTLIDLASQPEVVELTSDRVYNHPFLFMSGHGNVVLSDEEVRRLRRYLENGGFLYIDDDYGMDQYVRRELGKVFPDQELTPVPYDHPIYNTHYAFDHLPKIHEHDNEPPEGLGIFIDGRLAVFYTIETNISDGWESPEVHNDPPEKRQQALEFGTNIVAYALMY